MPAGIVTHRSPEIGGDGLQMLQQPVDRLALQVLWGALHRLIQGFHVGGMVEIVMERHRSCIDVRLQGRRVIGQRRKQVVLRTHCRLQVSLTERGLCQGIPFQSVRSGA